MGQAIAALAARQFGVVSRAQLLALGLSRAAIGRLVAAGRLHLLHRGVYAVGHTAMPRKARYFAALLATGPGSALSHRSGSGLHGLRPDNRKTVDVISPTRSRRSQPGIVVHLPRCLEGHEVTQIDGIPVTSVSRTLVDLAGVVNREAIDKALRRADQLRVLDTAMIDRSLAAGRQGSALLRAALSDYRDDLRNDFEADLLALIDTSALPRPRCNAPVAGYEADFLWPASNLIAEADGYATHGTRHGFEHDRQRDAALARAGYRVIRFSHRQVTNRPAEVAATLLALLA